MSATHPDLLSSRDAARPFDSSLLDDELEAIRRMESTFPFRIASEYASLIDWSDPGDPLRLQVVPSLREESSCTGESRDPLQEGYHIITDGLIHKYSGRVLWLITMECAQNCRFCFRRWKKGVEVESSTTPLETRLEKVVEYVRHHPEIEEVILSGGDPLMVPRDRLNHCIDRLSDVESLRLMRIHTRVPVVSWNHELNSQPLAKPARLPLRVVVHVNHPSEISPGFIRCVTRYTRIGLPVLSQSVLLSQINDSVETLRHLFMELTVLGIQPYYLHLPDPAEGTGHFAVLPDRAVQLISSIRDMLPGYAVPKLVRDIPGSRSKTEV